MDQRTVDAAAIEAEVDHVRALGIGALRKRWRMVSSGNTLIDHAVGAGKTFTMIGAGMEQKRLGLIRRPMFVVPNHMLEQFAREFLQAYPAAQILVADKDSMTRDKRRAFPGKTIGASLGAHRRSPAVAMKPAGRTQRGPMAFNGAATVTLSSSRKASLFWIILWLVSGPADHAMIPAGPHASFSAHLICFARLVGVVCCEHIGSKSTQSGSNPSKAASQSGLRGSVSGSVRSSDISAG